MEYIQYIRQIPSEEGRLAELALFRRQPDEAERILLQAAPPLVYRAVMLNIRLYRWDRALEVATKFKSHIDTVLGHRQKFLLKFGKKENLSKFKQSSSITVDWDAIEKKVKKEEDDEKNRRPAVEKTGRSNRK